MSIGSCGWLGTEQSPFSAVSGAVFPVKAGNFFHQSGRCSPKRSINSSKVTQQLGFELGACVSNAKIALTPTYRPEPAGWSQER